MLEIVPGAALNETDLLSHGVQVERKNETFWRVLAPIGSLPRLAAEAKGVGYIRTPAYRLGRNHPNPFNTSTTISFQLIAAGRANLSVFDVAGKLVRTPVNEEMGAGLNAVNRDGKDNGDVSAASGIYFYKIQAGSFTETEKMVLMR